MHAALHFYQTAANSVQEETKAHAFNVMYTMMVMMMMTIANNYKT